MRSSYLYNKKYWATKRGHMTRFLSKAKERATEKNLPIDLDVDYLESIATEYCPVFKTNFVWGFTGNGRDNVYGPSLDRVIPELGYVKGNVVFISVVANNIKQNVTEKELYAVADWLHDKRKEVLNAFRGKLPRLPEPCVTPGKKPAKSGPVHGAGPGQDCDGAHHYQAELFGTDPGGCT